MLRFTLGLAIIAFTLIIGTFQFVQNQQTIEVRKRAVSEADRRRDEALRLEGMLADVKQNTMLQGDDQKFTIERTLDIGDPGLTLRFIGQPRPLVSNQGLYRHIFRITGPATYEQMNNVIKKMAELPGFAPYRFCYGCSKTPKGTADNLAMVLIEGYIYVHDPALL